jgi:DNA-binding transcriptional regulator/RsmH inhibitor MraZ
MTMGAVEQTVGNNGRPPLIELYGYQGAVSLDSRGRFRLPDDLAGALQNALGAAERSPGSEVPPAVFKRLAFYFVPGSQRRIFLYPTSNIRLAIEGFGNPPASLPADITRRARDYFYLRMRFVEADRQNRLVIPDGLRQHAGIGEDVEQITLVAQQYWLALCQTELVERKATEDGEAFEQAADEVLDPLYRPPSTPAGGSQQADQQP